MKGGIDMTSIFRKNIPSPIDEYEPIISEEFGEIKVDEWPDHLRFCFSDQAFFLTAEGDLLRIAFSAFGGVCLERNLQYMLWLLNSAEVASIVNPKFRNKLSLRFSAALCICEESRYCVALPTDTVETLTQRLNNVWYKQAPIPGYTGDFACRVEE